MPTDRPDDLAARAATIDELLRIQARGYRLEAGVAPSSVGEPERRQWDDAHSVCLSFEEAYPVTTAFRFDWNLGYRVYEGSGFTDVDPTCYIYQDSEDVVYDNFLEKATYIWDP